MDGVVSYILRGRPKPSKHLTRREIECLYWVAQGKAATEVGIMLGITTHTARWYLKSIRSKLDCHNMAQAVIKFTTGLRNSILEHKEQGNYP
jgi:DNA-binding CsgD family transcriptional regulator